MSNNKHSTILVANKGFIADKSGSIVSFNAATKQILSSDTDVINFSNLKLNDRITVSGSTSNDGTYLVTDSGSNYVEVNETLITEAQGDNITIVRSGLVSDKFKADGYYGFTDGLHTVSYQLTSFIGDIAIQATLVSDPTTSDWFTVTGTTENYAVAESSTKAYNFTGNFVWIRLFVDNFTNGTINKILYNY